ncbi:MAG: hypothetical protein P1V20_24780, partial [Verrucomicrobiales bacterium]|nr:hypothetical protein [Verrucomicrobiales bacterium]
APVIVKDEAPVIVKDEAPVIVKDEAPVIVKDEAPVIVKDEAPVTVEDEAPFTVEDESPVTVEDEAPVIVEDEAPVIVEDEAPVTVEDEAPFTVEDEAPVTVEDEAPVTVEDEAPVIVKDEAPVIVENEDSAIVRDVAPIITEDERPVIAKDELPVAGEREATASSELETPVIAEDTPPEIVAEKAIVPDEPVNSTRETQHVDEEKEKVTIERKTITPPARVLEKETLAQSDAPLDLSCPACEKALCFQRAHVGIEGACVYCSTPIVATELANRDVVIVEIAAESGAVESAGKEEKPEAELAVSVSEIQVVEEEIAHDVPAEAPPEPDSDEVSSDTLPINIESLFSSSDQTPNTASTVETKSTEEAILESSDEDTPFVGIESLFNDTPDESQDEGITDEFVVDNNETAEISSEENEEDSRSESLALSCPTCHADLLIDHSQIGIEGACVECDTPIIAHKFDNGEVAVVRVGKTEDEVPDSEVECELLLDDEPEIQEEKQEIFIDPVAEVTFSSKSDFEDEISENQEEPPPLFENLFGEKDAPAEETDAAVEQEHDIESSVPLWKLDEPVMKTLNPTTTRRLFPEAPVRTFSLTFQFKILFLHRWKSPSTSHFRRQMISSRNLSVRNPIIPAPLPSAI